WHPLYSSTAGQRSHSAAAPLTPQTEPPPMWRFVTNDLPFASAALTPPGDSDCRMGLAPSRQSSGLPAPTSQNGTGTKWLKLAHLFSGKCFLLHVFAQEVPIPPPEATSIFCPSRRGLQTATPPAGRQRRGGVRRGRMRRSLNVITLTMETSALMAIRLDLLSASASCD